VFDAVHVQLFFVGPKPVTVPVREQVVSVLNLQSGATLVKTVAGQAVSLVPPFKQTSFKEVHVQSNVTEYPLTTFVVEHAELQSTSPEGFDKT
jgi:hypothetical protein